MAEVPCVMPEYLGIVSDECERCYKPLSQGEHGIGLCPFEPRRDLAVAGVVADAIPGGMTIYNMDHVPHTVYSRSEHRALMKRLGVRPHIEHVGVPGSDKSQKTSRWV